jgi:hypothetical protein
VRPNRLIAGAAHAKEFDHVPWVRYDGGRKLVYVECAVNAHRERAVELGMRLLRRVTWDVVFYIQ